MTWLPFSPTLTLGFAPRPGNAPGEEWPGVCRAYVSPSADPLLPGECWVTMGLAPTVEIAKARAEFALAGPVTDGAA